MPAFIVAVAGQGSVGSLQVLRRVLPDTLDAYRGSVLTSGETSAFVGQGLTDQSLVLSFPDAAAAKTWLRCPEQRAALTHEEATLLANAVIVEKPVADQESSQAVRWPSTASLAEKYLPAHAGREHSLPAPPAQKLHEAPAPAMSPTAIAMVALTAMIGCLVYLPELATRFQVEVRFLMAVFASCFVLALTGQLGTDPQQSRIGAIGTCILVLVFAAVISTLMSTPLVTLMAGMVDALRSGAVAMPHYSK